MTKVFKDTGTNSNSESATRLRSSYDLSFCHELLLQPNSNDGGMDALKFDVFEVVLSSIRIGLSTHGSLKEAGTADTATECKHAASLYP